LKISPPINWRKKKFFSRNIQKTFGGIHIVVFWGVTLHSVAGGCQHFGGPYCLPSSYLECKKGRGEVACIFALFFHRYFSLKKEATRSSKTLLTYHNTTGCHNPEDCNLNLHHSEKPQILHLEASLAAKLQPQGLALE